MAFRCSFEDDLSCPVCCDVFINPVVLSCSHSICEACIRRFWESKRLKECPVCRRRASSDRPPLNLALRNLCDTFRQELSRGPSFEGEGLCGLHKEKLKLFCVDDQEPVCLVCRDSRKHANHRFCPVEEAAADNKEILKDALQHLEEQRRELELFKEFFDEDDELVKSNAQDAERLIQEEFEELHRFLRDEESSRISALREEEKRRRRTIKQELEETSGRISSLSSAIRDVEEQMNADNVSFLQNLKASLQRARISEPPPEPRAPVMTRFSNHRTGLKLAVVQKMQESFARASSFDVSPSRVESDLAAMAISDRPDEYNERGRNLFGDLQLFKRKAPPTNIFPPLFGSEPAFALPLFHKQRLLQPRSTQSLVTQSYGRKLVVDRPLLQSVFRHGGSEESSSSGQDVMICEDRVQM